MCARAGARQGRLPQVVEQGHVARAADGAKRGFEGILGSRELDDGGCDIDVLDLGAELLEVGIGFLRTEGGGLEAVESSADISTRVQDAVESAVDIGDRVADGGAGGVALEVVPKGDEVIEDVAEGLATDDVDGD